MPRQSRPYLVIANMPACSAVLFVNLRLEPPYRVTLLMEHSPAYCTAWAHGYIAGSSGIRHSGSVELPAGNPAKSYAERLESGAALQ